MVSSGTGGGNPHNVHTSCASSSLGSSNWSKRSMCSRKTRKSGVPARGREPHESPSAAPCTACSSACEGEHKHPQSNSTSLGYEH